VARRNRKRKTFEQAEFTIEALSHDGRGIAQNEGKRVFIEGALAQERVLAQIRKKRSRYDEAVVVEVLTPSPQRVVPKCSQAGVCGGCSLQHLDSGAQLELKQSVLLEQLMHFGGITPETVTSPVADLDFHYRRKARLGVRYVLKREEVLVGFREKGSSFIADINACPVLDQRIGDKLTALRELIGSMEAYRVIPQIEVALGDTQVALVFRHLEDLSVGDLERLITFAQQHRIEVYLQPGGIESIHKLWPQSAERLRYHLPAYQLDMHFHPADFTQVNAGINEQMVGRAVALLNPQPQERVLDLFCGLGNFTLPLARSGATVVGVEVSQEMVRRGAENARYNRIDNVRFYAADLTQDFTAQPWCSEPFDKVLIDPPRSGALEVVQVVAGWRPQRIVYVSCNPATLARDAGELKRQGYGLKAAGILDMFPHTTHVESLAVFEPLS